VNNQGVTTDQPDTTDSAVWYAADSLIALGDCTARWLTGEIRYQPGYGGTTPDDETLPHLADLAAINRAGFVTDCSQPGELWSGGGQRAFLSGFCDEPMTERLRHFLLRTDLVVLAFWPGAETSFQLPVTVDAHRENTWVGGTSTFRDLEHYYADDLSPRALSALVEAWQVTVVDPVWGRDDLLFSAVLYAVTASGPITDPSNPHDSE